MTGRTVVIGVGNAYRNDDGLGPAVLDGLRAAGVPADVLAGSFGETAELIELWHGAGLAIVVDAVRVADGQPGRVHRLVVHERVSSRIRPASSHGLDFGEAVELARVLGRLPERLVLYAVEVADVGYGDGLSPAVAHAAAHVVDEIRAEIAGGQEPAGSGSTSGAEVAR